MTAMAARRFEAPIAIISIVDHDRIWFKSHHGDRRRGDGREPVPCARDPVVEEHVLLDASTDPRSLANPLCRGRLRAALLRRVPLRTPTGHNLGTLCVIDKYRGRSTRAKSTT